MQKIILIKFVFLEINFTYSIIFVTSTVFVKSTNFVVF